MKPYFLTMVYNSDIVFNSGMQSLRETADLDALGATHILLDQHWPVDYEKTAAAISEYRTKTPCAVVWDAGKNLGLHQGLTYMMERLEQVLKPDDILIAYDSDEHPWKPGWAEAMLRVFAADPKCAWLSLLSVPALNDLNHNNVPVAIVGGEKVRIPGYPLINTVCAWRVSAVREVLGGIFTEPYAYYGGLESMLMPKFTNAGYWVGWLVDYGTSPERDLENPLYRAYKDSHVGFIQPVFPGSFEEYLLEKGKAVG